MHGASRFFSSVFAWKSSAGHPRRVMPKGSESLLAIERTHA